LILECIGVVLVGRVALEERELDGIAADAGTLKRALDQSTVILLDVIGAVLASAATTSGSIVSAATRAIDPTSLDRPWLKAQET